MEYNVYIRICAVIEKQNYKLKTNIDMKNLRFQALNIRHYFYVLLVAFMSVGCSQHSDNDFKYDRDYQYSDGTWKNFGMMLTKCDSVTVVVAVDVNMGNIKAARYYATVVDSKGFGYTYCGAELDLHKGDTVKWVGNCH